MVLWGFALLPPGAPISGWLLFMGPMILLLLDIGSDFAVGIWALAVRKEIVLGSIVVLLAVVDSPPLFIEVLYPAVKLLKRYQVRVVRLQCLVGPLSCCAPCLLPSMHCLKRHGRSSG